MPGDPHPVLEGFQDQQRADRERLIRETIHAAITAARWLKNEPKGLAWLHPREQIVDEFAAKLI